MPGTGFKDRQWLIERDGRFIQVTELLYRVAEQANGTRTLEKIAEKVTESTDWMVDADDVLTPEEEALVRRGEEQLHTGEYVTLEQLEHDMGRKARQSRRKTTRKTSS